VRRGEIRWYRFTPPDKRRPVVILTRESAIEYPGEVSVAPITTTVREIPSEVVLSKDDGVPRRCAVNCDHIQTVPRGRIGKRTGELSAPKLGELREAVSFALGL
jgi:mRNA interferase MazF